MKVTIYTDGAARGNPGPAGAGAVLMQDGKILKKCRKFLGTGTNNEAEYEAVILGLEEAKKLGATDVEFFVDSELLQRQVIGIYKVKAKNLRPLFEKIFKLKISFASFKISHIRREKNKIADLLANEAIDGV